MNSNSGARERDAALLCCRVVVYGLYCLYALMPYVDWANRWWVGCDVRRRRTPPAVPCMWLTVEVTVGLFRCTIAVPYSTVVLDCADSTDNGTDTVLYRICIGYSSSTTYGLVCQYVPVSTRCGSTDSLYSM